MSTETVWPEELFKDLDRNGPVPLYFQVSSRLERAIREGIIPTGARLENEVSISQRLGLSRPTIRRAIQELVDKGLLVRRRGIGTQVVQTRMNRRVELTSLHEDLSRSGRNPSTRVLSVTSELAGEDEARVLQIEPGSRITRIRRVRYADNDPMAILENLLPSSLTDITAEDLEEHGLYQIMRARGVTIRIADQTIGARRSHGDEAELLDIPNGSPVLTMQRITLDDSGRIIEAGSHCYRPDLYSFETTLVAR